MSDVDQDLVLVAKRANALETILKNQYGATGNGLGEQYRSVADRLSPQLLENLQYIVRERNRTTHQVVALRDRDRFIRCCDAAQQELEAGVGAYSASSSSSSSSNYSSQSSPHYSYSIPRPPLNAKQYLPPFVQRLLHNGLRYESDDRCTSCGHEYYNVRGTWGMLHYAWDKFTLLVVGWMTLVFFIIAAVGPPKGQTYIQWVMSSSGGFAAVAAAIAIQCLVPYVLISFIKPKLLLRCTRCSTLYTSTTTLPKLSYALSQAGGYIILVVGLPLMMMVLQPILQGWSWLGAIALFIFGKRLYAWFMSWYT